MEHTNREPIPYWHWIPAAFALAGIIVFIFATFGPPASSSGFVSALKGFFEWVAPGYAASKVHYKAIPGPGSWLFAFVLGMAIGGFIAGRTSKKFRCAICRPSGGSALATAGPNDMRPPFSADS